MCMTYELPPLAYKNDSLEPWIDAKTMEIHHDKHHKTYCDRLNDAVSKHPELFKQKAEELLKDLNKIPEDIRKAVKNHGGGYVNHLLWWEILTGDKKKKEFRGKIAEAINKELGGFDSFKKTFTESALNQFGSGWAWLVVDKKGKLMVISTSNQDSPLSEGLKPVLLLDVWEHSYYLKYMNKRAEYIESWWNVVSWERVNQLYENALKKS